MFVVGPARVRAPNSLSSCLFSIMSDLSLSRFPIACSLSPIVTFTVSFQSIFNSSFETLFLAVKNVYSLLQTFHFLPQRKRKHMFLDASSSCLRQRIVGEIPVGCVVVTRIVSCVAFTGTRAPNISHRRFYQHCFSSTNNGGHTKKLVRSTVLRFGQI